MIFSVLQKLKRDHARFTAFNSNRITGLLDTWLNFDQIPKNLPSMPYQRNVIFGSAFISGHLSGGTECKKDVKRRSGPQNLLVSP